MSGAEATSYPDIKRKTIIYIFKTSTSIRSDKNMKTKTFQGKYLNIILCLLNNTQKVPTIEKKLIILMFKHQNSNF
jgi:hypothetical protein